MLERSAVGIKAFATGSNYDNGLRREIQDLTELCFLFPDGFFRNLTFPDIQDRAFLTEFWVSPGNVPGCCVARLLMMFVLSF